MRKIFSVVRALDSQSRSAGFNTTGLSQTAIHMKSMKGVTEFPENLVVKSKLSRHSCFVTLRQLKSIPKKQP